MAKWESLIAARNQMHLSQMEAAERLDVDLVTYQRWEQGKTRPQPQHLRKLYAVFGAQIEQDEVAYWQQASVLKQSANLSFPTVGMEPSAAGTREVREGMQTLLTIQMMSHFYSIVFMEHTTCEDICRSTRQAIEEFDSMNTNNKNYQISRREALWGLATLPAFSLGLHMPGKRVPTARYGQAIAECAASLEACWELSRSGEASERTTAFECAVMYLPVLTTIAQHSSKYRQQALDLATSYTLSKAYVARHNMNLTAAIEYGKEAVALSQESGNVWLQVSAYLALADSYFYDKKYAFALASAQAGEACLLRYQQLSHMELLPPGMEGRTYATLALMQARNGQSADLALGRALEVDLSEENKARFASQIADLSTRFMQSGRFITAGEAYYYQGDQKRALEVLGQRVNSETLAPKIAQTELGRIETINIMTLASLRAGDRDMEKIRYLWVAGIEGAKALQSEQRFNEALANYELMEIVWPNEQRIAELRGSMTHW
jgi:transcriptional regulator with XRE-family HTH domain/tetratricopeptide (TPR) repeat protein